MEKSKFKIIYWVLCICMIMPFMLFLTTGCLQHTHTYSETWSYDDTHHWKQATCSHTEEIIEYAEHNMVNNECTDCGYKIVYTVLASEWNNVVGGDYLKNVTVNETYNLYEVGQTYPIDAANHIYKFTETEFYMSTLSGNIVASEQYFVQEDDGVYSLNNESNTWYGTKMAGGNTLNELGYVGSGMSYLLVDRYSFFTYDSSDCSYSWTYTDENGEGDRSEVTLKAYFENNKLVKYEKITQFENASNNYSVETYRYYNHGITTIDVPSWTLATA